MVNRRKEGTVRLIVEADLRGPGGNADVEEAGQGWRGEFMDGVECMEEDLVSQCGV